MNAAGGSRTVELTAFSEAFGRAIEARGLPLERVSAHLRARGHSISIATLSYWKTGRSTPGRVPSLRAVGALEEVLRVPRGSLAVLIPQPVVPPGVPPARVVDLFEQQRIGDEMIQDLGRSWDEGIDIIAIHAVSRVDERLMLAQTHVREVLRTQRDGVDAYLVGMGYPVAGCIPVFEPIAGCRTGRSRTHLEASTCVTELLLPSPGAGVVHVLDYRISYPLRRPPAEPVPMTYVLRSTSPLREMYVGIDFTAACPDPAAPPHDLPFEVSRVQMTPADQTVRRGRARPRMSIYRADFGPGKLGFEWESLGS
ncbi:MAG: hypothetical protein IPK37_17835 [Austwickia sp.]|nr:MAG: hypothetical protein IPK37_17835 [Austwickia sp.]